MLSGYSGEIPQATAGDQWTFFWSHHCLRYWGGVSSPLTIIDSLCSPVQTEQSGHVGNPTSLEMCDWRDWSLSMVSWKQGRPGEHHWWWSVWILCRCEWWCKAWKWERLRLCRAIICSVHMPEQMKASQVYSSPEKNVSSLCINIKGSVGLLIRNCSFFYLRKAWIINDFAFWLQN